MLKKISLCLIVLGISSVALADPSTIRVSIFCPDATGKNAIRNFGDFVGGHGTETLYAPNDNVIEKKSIFFNSTPGQYPENFDNYYSDSVTYQSTTGLVSCNYSSSHAEHPVTVSYELINGKGAIVRSTTSDTIDLFLPLGAN